MAEVAQPPASVRARALSIAALAVAGLLVYAWTASDPRAQALASDLLVVASSVVSAVLVLRWSRSWPNAAPMSTLLLLLGLGNLVFFFQDLVDPGMYEPRATDLLFLLFLLPLGFAVHAEFREHFEPRVHREIGADAALIVLSLAALMYVIVLPNRATGVVSVSTAVFAVVVASLFTTFALLVLWVPTRSHVLLFLASAAASAATITFGWEWTHGRFDGTSPGIDLSWLLAPLAVAAVMTLVRHDGGITSNTARLARPILTSIAALLASSALALVAILDDARGIEGAESTTIILLLGLAVAIRILTNQVSAGEAHDDLREALQRKDAALAETDRALDRLRETNETLRLSERHLQMIFETAVDGFVELDHDGTVLQANEAFAAMVGLDRSLIEGQPWTVMAASIDGSDASMRTLPETGRGELHRAEGQTLYLESRVSELPTDPPRHLLLVRDVTAAKIADQTIRSLFTFLQDRDEDRTRLLRRTNAAIEQERNRLARDLHDGPVQGVSAASLSLEAALLMMRSGELEQGTELLAAVRDDLAKEADALRRLMSELRPPVLEERGLLAAIREALARFEEHHAVMTELSGELLRELPEDLETLTFRVVQEALVNVGRHAEATSVQVSVGTDFSQLRISVEDDGRGFDTAHAREYLRDGRLGLAAMRERVELASGTFAIRSSPGRGTAVLATIPLETALAIVDSGSEVPTG